MKKNITFLLLILMALNIFLISKEELVYGAEPQITLLRKSYDETIEFSEGLAFVCSGNKIGVVENPVLRQQVTKPKELPQKALLATPTLSKVLVNGKDISFDAYVINQNNYFKLRDLATAVRGTEKQFEVRWDENKQAINLISNKAYTSVGGEMDKGDGKEKIATQNTSIIYKDNVELKGTAYTINGNNYFKLRDIAKAFNIGVTWDNATKTVGINTSLAYVENEAINQNKDPKIVLLSKEEHRKINIFFSNFSEAYFSNYDLDNYNLGELIDFAYTHNKINNQNNIKIEDSEMYIDKRCVENTINKYFGLDVNHMSVGEFEYRNGRYYTPASDGESYNRFSQVDTLIDNRDGSYSANISIYFDDDYDVVNKVYYDSKSSWENTQDSYKYIGSAEAKVKKAVIDGKNTYQLLNYKEELIF